MDVMLDLETLDTGAASVVLSIGAVAFEPLQKFDAGAIYPSGQVFYQNVSIFEQLLAGRTISRSTCEWWATQSSEAQDALGANKISLLGALNRLVTWFNNLPGKERGKVWANSPSFDCDILEHAFKQNGMGEPWTFRDRMDCRTIKYVANIARPLTGVYTPPERGGVHHNALDDCFHQIACVQCEMQDLKNG